MRSHNATAILTEAIMSGSILDLVFHVNPVLSAYHHEAVFMDASYNNLFDTLLGEFDAFDSMLSFMLKTRIF